ncbi:MAG: phosphatase PAP2 family protein [Chloroflexota bacterium]
MRRLPDPTRRLVVGDDAAHRLGGAVPSPAAAFLLALIALPTLFWLVTLKRTTTYLVPEEWLMANIVAPFHAWVESTLPPLDAVLVGISGLGSGWFVAIGFAVLGLVAMSKGRRDLAVILAAGTLAFPIEWALKFMTAIPQLSLGELFNAIFNAGGVGLDDLADFPAGHALRATVFYGLAAFCVARLSHDRRQGMSAYAIALALIGAISLTRIYLLAHYPMDVLGGWIAGSALLAIIVAVHVVRVDEKLRARALPVPAVTRRRVAVELAPADHRTRGGPAAPGAGRDP